MLLFVVCVVGPNRGCVTHREGTHVATVVCCVVGPKRRCVTHGGGTDVAPSAS